MDFGGKWLHLDRSTGTELFFSLLLMRRYGVLGMGRLERLFFANLSLSIDGIGLVLVKFASSMTALSWFNKRRTHLRSCAFADDYAAGSVLVSEIDPW